MNPSVSQALDHIPMLPNHVQELFSILNDPEGETRDVADLVCCDPSLATQTLRVCNSAFFSLPVEVTSVHQAVVLLGMETVQGIAMASYFQSNVFAASSMEGGWLDGVAEHSQATAHLGRWLMQSLGEHLGAATVFTAGLIHDIGKLAFTYLGQEVEERVVERVQQGEDWCAAEQAVIGYTHAEVGGHVCDRWDLPESIATVVRYHHDPLEAVDEPMACVVHIADQLAHACQGGIPVEGPLAAAQPASWQSLGLEEDTVKRLADDLIRTWEASQSPV